MGLLQVRAGRDSVFYWLSDVAHGTASGTFVNHNHFAAMLAMMLPVIVGLLVFTIRYGPRRARPTRRRSCSSTSYTRSSEAGQMRLDGMRARSPSFLSLRGVSYLRGRTRLKCL